MVAARRTSDRPSVVKWSRRPSSSRGDVQVPGARGVGFLPAISTTRFQALAAANQVAHGEGAGTSELADASIAAAATAITFLPYLPCPTEGWFPASSTSTTALSS
jgi:hypothetical protein